MSRWHAPPPKNPTGSLFESSDEPGFESAVGIQRQFELFHSRNPQVYRDLVRLARQWKEAGRKQGGIKMLFEVLRYDYGLKTEGDEFKLNNNYHSRYARLIMERESDLNGFFELRELQTD